MTIKYSLYESKIPAIAGKYVARTDMAATVTISVLAGRVAMGISAEASEVEAILAATCNTIEKILLEGQAVELGGIARIGTSIKGTFPTFESNFDPLINSIDVTATAGARIKRTIRQKAIAEKQLKPMPSPNVVQFKDVNTATYNSVITDGGLGQINGVDLDLDLTDPDQGVFIVDAVPGPTPETKVTILQKHTAGEIVFMVPDISLYTEVVLVIRRRNTPTGPLISGQSVNLNKV